MNRVLFPAFVRVKDQPEALKQAFLQAQGMQSLIAIPASAGLALVAPQLVTVMLGPKWAMAVPFIQILAVAYLASAMLSCATSLLITLEKIRVLAVFSWVQALVFATLAFWLFAGAAAQQVAWLRLAMSVATDLAFMALVLHYFKPVRLHDLLRSVVRPLLAACAMACGLLMLEDHWGSTAVQLILPAKILTGAALYGAAIALQWLAAGQPEGAEAHVLRYLLRSRQEEHP
jgi:O-antigen/teichoic acid export membrane protein